MAGKQKQSKNQETAAHMGKIISYIQYIHCILIYIVYSVSISLTAGEGELPQDLP